MQTVLKIFMTTKKNIKKTEHTSASCKNLASNHLTILILKTLYVEHREKKFEC